MAKRTSQQKALKELMDWHEGATPAERKRFRQFIVKSARKKKKQNPGITVDAFVKLMVKNQRQSKRSWWTWVGTVDGKSVEIKAYGTWIQIMRVDGIKDSGPMDAKVKDFKAYLLSRLGVKQNPALMLITNPRAKGVPKKPDPKALKAYKKFHLSDPGEVRMVQIPKGWPKSLIVIGCVDRLDVQDASTGREISKRYSGDAVKVCMPPSRNKLFILSTNGRSLGLKSGVAMRIDYTVPPTSGRNKWSPRWWHPHDSGPKLTVERGGKAARVNGPKLKINVRGIIG